MDSARVLIAGEGDVLTRVASWLLKDQGYAVTIVPVAHVLDHLASFPPDVLIIDALVPTGAEFQLLERLQEETRWRELPVLVVAPRPADDPALRGIGRGLADFVTAPVDAHEILARIRVHLRLRADLVRTRAELQATEAELRRARDEADNRGKLVDILQEVTGDFSSEELYQILVRRVARALNISYCSLILARAGDTSGVVAAAYEMPGLRHLELRLEKYPEIREALDRGQPVLVEDVATNPLYDGLRGEWAAAGTTVPFRSVLALPFQLDRERSGVIFLRTLRDQVPLRREDMEFADAVLRTAVTAIRRAHAIETTRADKARLEVLALTDPLTRTHNRRSLVERLTAELERARRYGLLLSLLLVDIDHFKAVNDSYGHVIGDQVLRGIARVLLREARTVDVVARYGGEEFVVVLPETPEDGAVAVAERIRARIASYAPVPGEEYDSVRVTVSIGVATAPLNEPISPDGLIAMADDALYQAKAEGRDRVRSRSS